MTFGRLHVLSRAPDMYGSTCRKDICYFCQCECGNTKVVRGRHLRSGRVQSCGCLWRENLDRIHSDNVTHGETNTRLYNIWSNILDRCTNENNHRYDSYGGRGIHVCDEWRKYESFRDWAVTHGYDDSLTIDRIDNDKGYNPSNCRWANAFEQARNKSTSRLFDHNGIMKSVAQLSEESGIDYQTLYARLAYYNWPIDKALGLSVAESKKIPTRQRLITYQDKTKSLTEWAKDVGMSPSGFKKRIQQWGVTDRSFTAPTKKGVFT